MIERPRFLDQIEQRLGWSPVDWKGRRVGFQFKYGDAPGLTKSMHIALRDLKLDQLFVVYPGSQSFSLGSKAELVAFRDLLARLERFNLEKAV